MIDEQHPHKSRLRRQGLKTEQKYIIVPKGQLKLGYIEMQGVKPVHHEWIVISETEKGNYVCLAPKGYEE